MPAKSPEDLCRLFQWTVSGPQSTRVYAIEVARRQPDGTWRWLIGDPFTVGREAGRQ
jgi:hypothetical protein